MADARELTMSSRGQVRGRENRRKAHAEADAVKATRTHSKRPDSGGTLLTSGSSIICITPPGPCNPTVWPPSACSRTMTLHASSIPMSGCAARAADSGCSRDGKHAQ